MTKYPLNPLLSNLLDILLELEKFSVSYVKNLENKKGKYEAERYMFHVKVNFAEQILKTVDYKAKANRDKDILHDALMMFLAEKFTKEEVMHLMTNVQDETVVEHFYQRI